MYTVSLVEHYSNLSSTVDYEVKYEYVDSF
jgi:hypothetical protein